MPATLLSFPNGFGPQLLAVCVVLRDLHLPGFARAAEAQHGEIVLIHQGARHPEGIGFFFCAFVRPGSERRSREVIDHIARFVAQGAEFRKMSVACEKDDPFDAFSFDPGEYGIAFVGEEVEAGFRAVVGGHDLTANGYEFEGCAAACQ